MNSLKNNTVAILGLIIYLQSCKLNKPITIEIFSSVYVANRKIWTDTLIINKNFTFYHKCFEQYTNVIFSQTSEWKSTVNDYFELKDWKTNSKSLGGADVLPTINKISGEIEYSYPLVTTDDINYIKINTVE